MILYFADRTMQILGMASTELPEGLTITDDLKSEDVDSGVAIFECTIPYNKDNRALVESCTSAGNYLLRSNDGENEFYTIIETEADTKNQTVYIYAEDAGMDLLNEINGAYEATEAHPISYYVEYFANDTGFVIGINEIENLTRTLSWDGEATTAERLASVATQFDNAEISYSFDVKGLEITNKYINIYAQRGKDAGIQLRLNKDIGRIITKKSVADLATSLRPTGGIPEGEEDAITLKGYEYDDGDFYVTSEGRLNSREALKKWSRYVWEKEPNQQVGYTGHIVKAYSYDTTSQSELCNRAISELKDICDVAVNYEVDINTLPDNVAIGDTVDIVDDAGELYLSARILEMTTSVCNQKQTATLGDYLIKDSGISQTVADLAAQFSELAKSRVFYTWIAYADDEEGTGISLDASGKRYLGIAANRTVKDADISDPSVYTWSLIQGTDGKDALVLQIDSSAGNIFKNNKVSTTLSAIITSGDTVITASDGMISSLGGDVYLHWQYKAEDADTYTDIDDDSFALTITNDDVAEKTVFRCAVYDADGELASAQITLVDITDGYFVTLSNESYTFQGGTSGLISETQTTTCLVQAFCGTEAVACEIGDITVPDGLTITSDGETTPTLTITVTDELTSVGSVTIPVIIGEITIYKDFSYSVAYKGSTGEDGKGISGTVSYYLVSSSSSGITTSTSGWKTSIQTMTSTNRYLWYYCVTAYTDGTSYTSTPIIIGVYGDTGEQGIQGLQGEQGEQGIAGEDGKTSYFHIKYSAVASPTASDLTETPSDYIGTYVDYEAEDSDDPGDYTWSRFSGEDGEQGIAGTDGKDGTTYYLHIAYANSEDGTTDFSVDDSTDKEYIGIYTDTEPTDSTAPSAYSWTKIKGEQGIQGLQGIQGEQGEQGIQGEAGADGKSSYFHIKYSAVESPTASDMTEIPSTYIGTYVDYTEADSTNPSDYTWSKWQGEDGEQGIQGENGENGETYYLHIAYSNSSDGSTDFSVSDSTDKEYIGVYTDTEAEDSIDPTKYAWTKIKGEQGIQGLQGLQGEQGEQGIAGADGKTSYFHIKYSEVENPAASDMTETPSTYIGTYVDYTETDSDDPDDYTWTKWQGSDGADGIAGKDGADGTTYYLHIAYATSADGTEGFSVSDSTDKAYIGQYVNTESADSTDPADYKWTLIKGTDGADGKDGADGQDGADGKDGADGADGQMLYATCDTAESTQIKVATLSSGSLTLTAGATVAVTFTYTNTATAPRLNVGGTGTKIIHVYGKTISSSSPYNWIAGSTIQFVYDGTYWVMSDTSALYLVSQWCASADTTYIDGGKIYTGTVTADQIAANTITADQIAANTITANELNVDQLSAITADLGAITAGSITVKDDDTVIFKVDMDEKTIVINTGGLTLDADGNVSINGNFISYGTTTYDGEEKPYVQIKNGILSGYYYDDMNETDTSFEVDPRTGTGLTFYIGTETAAQYGVYDCSVDSITVKESMASNGTLYVASTATINGTLTMGDGNIIIQNGSTYYAKDNTGTSRTIATLTTDNYYYFGSGGIENRVYIGTQANTTNIALQANNTIYAYCHMLVRQAANLTTSNTGRAFQVQSTAENTWADSSDSTAIFVCGVDTTSPYIRSYPTYNRTGSTAANVNITSSGTFNRYNSSASRYKNTINYFDNAEYANAAGLAKRDYTVNESDYREDYQSILKIPVVQFHYNEGYMTGEPDYDYGQYVTGFIAEDVAATCPACATYTEDGVIEAWDHMQIIPRMLAVIQELYRRVTELEARA